MSKRVVVTGVGAISPVGLDANESWSSIKNGKLGISNIESFDASNLQVKIAAEVKGFDPESKLGKKDSRRLDRFSQFAVVASLEALEQSGVDLENEDPTRFSSIIGSGVGGIMTLSEQFDVLTDKETGNIYGWIEGKDGERRFVKMDKNSENAIRKEREEAEELAQA